MKLTGAQILIKELIKHNVDVVFGYPGGAVLDIYDEIYKNSDKIEHILTAHEQGASFAADGYARASGKPGVVIATSGPGATNLVTGIANAYLDSIPIVAITGNVAVSMLGKDSFQEVDIVGITQPIVKHNFIVKNVEMLESTLKEAFCIANSGRKGPVLVDIPKSTQKSSCFYDEKTINVCEEEPTFSYNIKDAVEMIKKSKKPYIYCGGGVISSGAEKEVLSLSKKISAPIGLSMMGLSAIPSSYELNLGLCGMHGKYSVSKIQAETDLIIAIGVRFSDRATGNVNEYTKNCNVIHIDIDDAEIGKNVSYITEICGDAKEVVAEILNAIEPMENRDWLKKVEKYKKMDIEYPPKEFSPKNIITTVKSFFDKDVVVATDVGQHQMWVMQFCNFENTRRLLTSGGLGSMGYGLGAAIGGCFASGKKRTILFTGDGSFGMNLNELATVVKQNLPLVIVIMNNGCLGMVRQWQTMFYDKRYSQTTLCRQTNFKLLAEAFGLKGFEVKNLTELESVLKDTNKIDGPVLIDCKIEIDEKVLPMIPPGGSIKDIVVK